MSLQQARKQFFKALELAGTLKGRDFKAIHRAAWGHYPDTKKADRAIAEAHGLNVDVRHTYSHATGVKRARDVVAMVELRAAVDAFVVGLNPDQIRWRAPLQAYAAVRQLPAHRADLDKEMFTPSCRVCAQTKETEWNPIPLAFQIAESGSVMYIEYVRVFDAAMCLEWFLAENSPRPQKADWKRLSELFRIAAGVPTGTTGNKLANLLKPVLGGDKYKRQAVIETLGFLGVLINPAQPGDLQQWTNWRDRAYGGERNQETAPPACGWRRQFGVDADICASLFPDVRIPKSLIGQRA